MIQRIISFFSHPFFVCVGGLTTLLAVAGLLYAIYLLTKGLLPVWYRLGMGLAKRKIAVFATDEFANLQGMLIDSHLFKQKNILHIDRESLKKGVSATLILVHWKPFKAHIDEILRIKSDSDAMIIYAPQKEGFIDDASLDKINSERNAIIVNFRGRLLNDILTSMITTSYEKG
jgi:hypothetical protein